MSLFWLGSRTIAYIAAVPAVATSRAVPAVAWVASLDLGRAAAPDCDEIGYDAFVEEVSRAFHYVGAGDLQVVFSQRCWGCADSDIGAILIPPEERSQRR